MWFLAQFKAAPPNLAKISASFFFVSLQVWNNYDITEFYINKYPSEMLPNSSYTIYLHWEKIYVTSCLIFL